MRKRQRRIALCERMLSDPRRPAESCRPTSGWSFVLLFAVKRRIYFFLVLSFLHFFIPDGWRQEILFRLSQKKVGRKEAFFLEMRIVLFVFLFGTGFRLNRFLSSHFSFLFKLIC